MRSLLLPLCLFATVCPLWASPPGVDNIELPGFQSQTLSAGAVPLNQPAVSGGDGSSAADAGNAARMARFSAKVMTLDAPGNSAGFDSNVQVRTAENAAGNLCVMDIGSVGSAANGFSQFGPTAQSSQPVLIRGNVINVCR